MTPLEEILAAAGIQPSSGDTAEFVLAERDGVRIVTDMKAIERRLLGDPTQEPRARGLSAITQGTPGWVVTIDDPVHPVHRWTADTSSAYVDLERAIRDSMRSTASDIERQILYGLPPTNPDH